MPSQWASESQTHRNGLYSLPADVQWRGEKQATPCDPSPPVLEGPWVINSALTKSPLARHQAHVVPEQIPFKVYMFHLPVLCSSLSGQPAPLSSLIANSWFQPADYRILQPDTVRGLNISPTSRNPSKIQTRPRASRSYWSTLSTTGSYPPKKGVWHIIANNTDTNNYISILLFFFFFLDKPHQVLHFWF